VGFVTGAEVVAALRRKEQTGAASSEEVSRVVAEFRGDWWSSWTILDANRTVLERAMDLANRRYLRGYDAIQLAFALVLSSNAARQNDTVTLWSSDIDLLAAAQAEGLATVDPSQTSIAQ
jgi:predicted nucleic acid-binding protein